MSTLFLCTGNINRSAAAEVISRMEGVPAQSAGASLHARQARPMSRQMRLLFAPGGLGAKLAIEHRSRYVGDVDPGGVEQVVGFQPSHALAAALHLPGVPYHCILELAPHEIWTRKVPDPAFDAHAYGEVFRYLMRVVRTL